MWSEALDFAGVVGMIVMASDDDASSVESFVVVVDFGASDVVEADVIDVADAVSVDAIVKLNVDVEDTRDDSDDEDDEVLLSKAHTLPPWHSYPNGQHEPPHLGNSSSNLVVCTGFLG